jgi:aspartate kinase
MGNIVVKFGGTSLADSERISRAASSVAREAKKGSKIVVVVSAMGKMTDQLLETAMKSSPIAKSNPKVLDDILSMGERTSARIFRAALKSQGIDCRYFDPTDSDWPIITDDSYGKAQPILSECRDRIEKNIVPLWTNGVMPVIPGFVGKTLDGRITTIGRGGSDTTAFILAEALNADQIVLVTDVPGIMTADPKLVKNPRILPTIRAESLAGLADSGAKFMHKRALRFKPKSIDVRVIASTPGRLDIRGTVVKDEFQVDLGVSLVYPDPVAIFTILGDGVSKEPRVISEITERVKKAHIHMLGMTANTNSLIMYLPNDLPKSLIDSIHAVVLKNKRILAMAVKRNMAFLKISGVELEETPGIIGKISEPLRGNNINMSGIFTIASSITVLVDWNDRAKALELIQGSLKEVRE